MKGKWVWGLVVSAVAVCACLFMGVAARGAGPAPLPAQLSEIQYPFTLDTGGVYTTLVVDPFAETDPALVWNVWRMENKKHTDPPLLVLQAHEIWARFNTKLQCPEAQTLAPAWGELRDENFTASANVPISAPVVGEESVIGLDVDRSNTNDIVASADQRLLYDSACTSALTISGVTLNSNGGQEVYWSTNGGSTWSHQCAPWPSSASYTLTTSNGTSPFTFQVSDPSVAFDTSGNAYILVMGWWQDASGSYSGSVIYVDMWSVATKTWSPVATLQSQLGCTSTTCTSQDKTQMTIDTTSGQAYSHTNRMYATFTRITYSSGWVYTDWMGYADPPYTSWTLATFKPGGTVERGSYPRLAGRMAVGADGTAYYAWDRVAASGGTDRISKSTDGGATWSSPVSMCSYTLTDFSTATDIAAQDVRGITMLPSIAVDACATSSYKGYLYMAYTDYHSGVTSGNDVDAYVRRSTDGGSTWSTVDTIAGITSGTSQFHPWLAVDQASGVVTVAWHDTSSDPTNNTHVQIYASQSADGGTTWSAQQLVTDSGANFSNHLNYCDENSTDMPDVSTLHHYQYGEYMGAAAAGGKVWLAWIDSRNWLTGTPSNTEYEDVAISSLCTNPGAPSITSITDNNVCVQDGIHVNYTTGSGAASHNLLKDGIVVVAGYASGALYNPGDSASHTYVVQAISGGSCAANSTGSAFADATGSCAPPPEAAPGSTSSTAQAWTGTTTQSWPPVTGATSYTLYRGTQAGLPSLLNSAIDSCTKYTGSSTSATISEDPTLVMGRFYWYIVTASNASGEGPAGNATAGARTVNSSGTCP